MGKTIALKKHWSYTELLHAAGNKRKPLMSHEPTGNIAVDMIAECIIHNNKQGTPIRSVTLYGTYWKLFVVFVKIQMKAKGVEYFDGQPLAYHGIDVLRGTAFIKHKKIEWEYLSKAEGLAN